MRDGNTKEWLVGRYVGCLNMLPAVEKTVKGGQEYFWDRIASNFLWHTRGFLDHASGSGNNSGRLARN